MQNRNNAVKFDRVSSKDQRDGFSLDAQKRLGEKYASENELEIVKLWSVDESASKHKDRKHFSSMIEFVKQNEIKNVIFDKVDRACRNLESAVQIEDLIHNHAVKFHFTREHLIIDKGSPPQEKLRFYLGIILGKYYIDNLQSEIRKGLDERVKNGHWNGKAPFGYKNRRTGSNNKAVVEVDAKLKELVKDVFHLYATGNYGWDALAEHIQSKVPDRKITKRLVENMIVNPFYYGHMKIKGQVIKGAHEPIITKNLFDACQKVKGIRAKNFHSTRKGHILKPFMGMFKCGECGHAITGESVKKNNGKTYIYYRCANSKCAQHKKRVNQASIEEAVVNAFAPFRKWTPKATEAFIKSMAGRLEDLDLYTQKMSGELAEQRLELKKRIVEVTRLFNDQKLTAHEYESIMKSSESLLEEKTLEIKAYQETDLKTFRRGCEIIQLFRKVGDFMHLSGNELEKARLAKEVLSNPNLKDGTICFSYKKPLDDLLSLTEVPNWWRKREVAPKILLQLGTRFPTVFQEILAA